MRTLLYILLILWAVAFFGSFIVFYLAPSRELDLAAGLNRLSLFMGFQVAAFVLAVACLVMRWLTPDPGLKRLAAIPAVAAGALVLVFGGLALWANLEAGKASGMAPGMVPVPAGSGTAPAANG